MLKGPPFWGHLLYEVRDFFGCRRVGLVGVYRETSQTWMSFKALDDMSGTRQTQVMTTLLKNDAFECCTH